MTAQDINLVKQLLRRPLIFSPPVQAHLRALGDDFAVAVLRVYSQERLADPRFALDVFSCLTVTAQATTVSNADVSQSPVISIVLLDRIASSISGTENGQELLNLRRRLVQAVQRHQNATIE